MYVCNLLLLASNVREPCKLGASMYVHGGGRRVRRTTAAVGKPFSIAPKKVMLECAKRSCLDLLLAHRLALEGDLVGGVHDAVEDRIG